MSGADLQRMESYQYPATHVGHLNPGQEKALEAFKELCLQKGYYTPTGGPNGTPSHDDETMLRYLRARKFIPNEAFGQFKDTEDWRKENQLEKLYDTIDVSEYEQTRVLYPQWTGRQDRRGIPVYIFEVAHLNSKAVSAYEASTSSKNQSVQSKIPAKMLRLFALYENLTNFVLPLCSEMPGRPFPETPVSQSSNIVDISNVGLRQFWNLKNHMQDASQLATAHYPETLDRIFIIGAPSFFPTVWSWVKKWFDPITVSKIFILSKQDMYPTLSKYIDPENIPEQYGGKLKYKFGELPNIDPDLHNVLQWTAPHKLNGMDTIPTGPIRWVTTETGDKIARAVGTENGKPRDRNVATVKSSAQPTPAAPAASQQARQDADLYRTTSGEHTHPPSPPPGQVIQETPYNESSTPSAGNTSTLPVREIHQTESTQTSSNQPSTNRTGTSGTSYIAQSHTHAHGTLADGTPDKREGTFGDTYGVNEPNTIGQAPKEHPMPEPEIAQPTYVEQAKQVAGSAYSTAAGVGASALAAVGYGNGVREDKVEEEVPKKVEDPRVDATGDRNVEEYLRSKYESVAAAKAVD
ncbi:CRAL/TRIO domain-containing protein [Aureobasidium pullulans]|nr:CRAL/TRIO domain-containing protein [Aureobasidium pullulans]